MKSVELMIVMIFTLMIGLPFSVVAHTPAESNEVVRIMLDSSMNHPDNLDREGPRTHFRFYDPTVFFGMEAGQGWTPEGRRAAFEDFVEHMGTVDFNCTTNVTRRQVAKAVAQCANFNYTNAAPALRRLAMNAPYHERYRKSAIRVAIRLGGVCQETTDFVDSIVTNASVFSINERCEALCVYGGIVETAETNPSIMAATQLLVRHRTFHKWCMVNCDSVFTARIDGYVSSSNRLEYANFALSQNPLEVNVRRYFENITNQLLSAGQPLQQLNLEGDEQ